MNLLKMRFPMVWTRLQEIQKNLDKKLVKTSTSAEGMPNLLIKNKSKRFLHDKDNPVGEAEDVINQYQDVEEYSDILLYGLGLGYHLNAFVKKYPGTSFSLYEPVPEIFFQYLAHVDLAELPLSSVKYLFIEDKPIYANIIAHEFVGQMRDSVLVIDFPAYQELFEEQYKYFFTQFEDAINERKSAVNTTAAFEKLWILNSMLNLEMLLSTPNILLNKKDRFKNKPALLIGAGPSLEDEMENLRHIKENGLAYIFSAGAAINTLVDHDIHPHAACSYDPSERNQIVFQKLINQGITDIPLVFGSSIGYATLEQYPGPKFHMLTSPDKVAPFYLQATSGEQLEIISDAPSISAIVLQLLIKLGFNPIILVGLNLAYKDKKQHAAGLDYSNPSVSDKQLDMALAVEDVYGNEVLTNHAYNRMKLQMEMHIDMFPDFTIINTTRGGAKIKGTTFKPLDELISGILKENIYEENWLDLESFSYDTAFLIKQFSTMKRAREKLDKLIATCNYFLHKIDKQAERRKFRNIEYMYAAIDDALNHVKNNAFFNTFIMPMNQLADEVFQRAILNINREKDLYKQAKKMVIESEEFIYSCENDIQMISAAFERMNNAIENFIVQQIKAKAGKIKMLALDCSGILTDGSFYCSGRGNANLKLNIIDKVEIKHLQEQGIITAIITGDNNKTIENACRQLGIQHIFMDVKDKGQVLETICTEFMVSNNEIAYIIHDVSDLEPAGKIGLTFTVNDAPEKVKEKVDYVCTLKGGEGVLREVAQVLRSDDFPVHGTIIRSL